MSLWSWRPQSGAETDAAQTPTQSAGPPRDCSGDNVGASRSLNTEESPESVLGLRAEASLQGWRKKRGSTQSSRLAGVSAGLSLEPDHSRAFGEWPVAQEMPACGL